MINNKDFELGTCRDTFNGTVYNEIEVPENWIAWWSESSGFYRPEMKVITKNPPYLDPLRINTGNKALMFFGFYKKIKAGVFQQVTVPNNSKIALYAYAYSWYSQLDDPHKSQWVDEYGVIHTIPDGGDGIELSVGIDPTGETNPFSDNIIWHTGKYYSGFGEIKLEATVSGTVTIFLKGEAQYPFKHCDVYFDTVELTVEQESDGCPCPRIEYEKTYHLLPQSASLENALEVAQIAYNTRGTMGYCPDDAGQGPISQNVISYWPDSNAWQPNELEDFFDTYYPGVNLTRVNLYNDPEPPIDPPDQETIEHPSNNFIGLHMGESWPKWDEYLIQAKPGVAKCFSLGFALQAKQLADQKTLVVWRKHSDNHVDCVPPLYENAVKLVDFYDAEIQTVCNNSGISRDDLLIAMDGMAIESVNEKIPTFNLPVLQNAVEFDRIFCELVHERFNGHLRPAILTAAIGNPHESEVEYLIPAVEAAIQYNGLIGYHSYWTSNQNDNSEFITEHWDYHAGRWMKWDEIFRAHNLYPLYYLGEGGIVYSDTGTNFHSGLGWRSCGSFDKYLTQINIFNNRVLEWNSANNGRCYGLTIFHYGNWGWDNFKLGEGDIVTLKNWALSL